MKSYSKWFLFLALLAGLFLAGPAMAGGTSYSYSFGGADTVLASSQAYTSNGATITAYGYVCWSATPSSTDTLSGCSATDMFAKDDSPSETGLGLYGEAGIQNEIGWDGPSADYVIGLDVSGLYNLGVKSMTLSFGSVQAGEAFAVLGYASDPFVNSSFALTNTKAWVGNDGTPGNPEIYSVGFDLNAQDEYLVLISPCGASLNPPPCGSNVTLQSLTAPTPEPGSLGLLTIGMMIVGLWLRRGIVPSYNFQDSQN